MKILHVVSSYWPAFEFGGPIQSVHLLNKYLAGKGADITVYTTNAGLRTSDVLGTSDVQNIGGVKIIYFPYYGYVHWTFSPALFLALAKNIKNFDLIHITGVWNFPIMAAAFWARFYKKPYIISPRGSLMALPLEMKNSPLKKIHLFLVAKRDLKNASALHFTTEAEKEEYLKAGLPLKKAVIISNCLDISSEFQSYEAKPHKIDFREKFGIAADKKIVLFLGRLNWKKGLDTLIPAFAEVVKKEPKAILVIAGPDDNGYKKKIELEIGNWELEINKDVIFAGMLVGAEKIAAYQESDVFVLPSYSENFGMAVAEAMYFNLPVVITKNVGIAPSVSRVGTGLVVEKDEKQVSEAILKILNNPDLAEKMGQAGKYLVETEFSPDSVAERFLKLYNEL